MTSGMKTVTYPVKDLAAGKQFYASLFGVEPYTDEVYYVGFNVEGQEAGLDPNGFSKGMTGPSATGNREGCRRQHHRASPRDCRPGA